MWMSTLHTSWVVVLHKNKYCWYKSSFKVTHFIFLWIFSNLIVTVLSHFCPHPCFFYSNLTNKFHNSTFSQEVVYMTHIFSPNERMYILDKTCKCTVYLLVLLFMCTLKRKPYVLNNLKFYFNILSWLLIISGKYLSLDFKKRWH